MAIDLIAQILFAGVSTGQQKARFEFLLRKWRKSLFERPGVSDAAKKQFINRWLNEFETIFRNETAKIGSLSGFKGWVAARNVAEVEHSIDVFLEVYRNRMPAIFGTDLTMARMLRNDLARRMGSGGYQEMYTLYDEFSKEAAALGLSQRERVEGFMNGLGKEWTTLRDRAGKEWKPENYARMYSNTRDGEIYDIVNSQELVEVGIDVVQISDHGTNTPICQQYEGQVFSLTGITPGLPILEIMPPFHPNCKHIKIARPDLQANKAKQINRKQKITATVQREKRVTAWRQAGQDINERVRKESRYIRRQEKWNVVHRGGSIQNAPTTVPVV